MLSGLVSYGGLGLGFWYLGAPFVWGYPFGFLWWHSIVLGGSILVVSITYQLGVNRISGWGLIALGAYSMLSPFIHGYLPNAQAFFNDSFFGIATIGAGIAMGGEGIVAAEEARPA